MVVMGTLLYRYDARIYRATSHHDDHQRIYRLRSMRIRALTEEEKRTEQTAGHLRTILPQLPVPTQSQMRSDHDVRRLKVEWPEL